MIYCVWVKIEDTEGHGGKAGSIATSHLQGPQFDPDFR